MIISKLIGGLGNQMFQYAAGKRAAVYNKTILKLDITGYRNQQGITPRQYMLNIFNIEEHFATEDEIQRFKKPKQGLLEWSNKIFGLRNNYVYAKEKHFHFDSEILNIKNNSYLEGFWACEKYFIVIKDIILKEFTLKQKPDKRNENILDEIRKTNSISIHFRRGDYVLDKKTQAYHGICSLDYYYKAVSIIVSKIRNPNFFVFSDDPEWVKNNFKLKYPMIVIDNNTGKKDYEDLRLMSCCKHNIIANSAFGWWAAWLNKRKDKIVVAPKRWFRDSSINTKDIIPNSWIRI